MMASKVYLLRRQATHSILLLRGDTISPLPEELFEAAKLHELEALARPLLLSFSCSLLGQRSVPLRVNPFSNSQHNLKPNMGNWYSTSTSPQDIESPPQAGESDGVQLQFGSLSIRAKKINTFIIIFLSLAAASVLCFNGWLIWSNRQPQIIYITTAASTSATSTSAPVTVECSAFLTYVSFNGSQHDQQLEYKDSVHVTGLKKHLLTIYFEGVRIEMEFRLNAGSSRYDLRWIGLVIGPESSNYHELKINNQNRINYGLNQRYANNEPLKYRTLTTDEPYGYKEINLIIKKIMIRL